MPFDVDLADRVRDVIAVRDGVTEKKMFGAYAFFIGGNMACGVLREELFVRLAPDEAQQALSEPGVRPFEMGRGTAKNMVLVAPETLVTEHALAQWVDRGAQFAGSLPPKP